MYASLRHSPAGPGRHSRTRRLLVRAAVLTAAALLSGTAAALTRTELNMKRQGLVDIQTIDSTIRVSLMYTRPDNFTGQVLYTDLHHAYLHPQAARALKQAQAALRRRRPDLSLKVYDAARPMSIQQRMWNVVKGTSKNIYVSNPARGGGLHNYGLAVDITLCNARGDTLEMGTRIDYMGRLAHIDDESRLTARQRANRRLLRSVMREAGFKALRTEWWHFNFRSRATAKKYYKVIR